ncbi:MAG: metallophosphoesterase [Armatimonadota bacterium]
MRTVLLVAALAVLVVILLARLLMTRTGREVRATCLRLTVPDLSATLDQPLRMAALSDLHVGSLNVPADRLIAAVDAAHPDVLLLCGDYAAGLSAHDEALELIAALSADRPTFGVLGNTDHYQHFDSRRLREILRAGGGDLLINEAGHAHVGDMIIEVLGMDDPLHGGASVSATLEAAGGDADVRVGLCHSPVLWQKVHRLDAAITIFGHTHGGQIRPPGVEAPVTHTTYPRELAAGLFRHEEGADRPRRLAGHWEILRLREPLEVSTTEGPLMYITRGLGMGGLPVRVMCPPEMLVIEMVREKADGGAGRDG